ncbi:MAG TPA: hypothetical protein VNV44_06720 [Solirubrobacteraceae bacterium]|nr:hypothetical protein [Solirubrobacteraceae bacterium]
MLAEKHFGARLIAPDAVCSRCNSLAGRVESLVAEHPFLSEPIARFVASGGAKRLPQSTAVLGDGAHVQLERGADSSRVIAVRPREIGTDADGSAVWQVAEGAEREFEVRRSRHGERVRAVGRPMRLDGVAEVHYPLTPRNFAAWARFVAKVALATASLVLDEAWLDTGGARALQDLLHERPRRSPGYGLPLYPWEQDRSRSPCSRLNDGEHLLGLWRHAMTGELRFTLVLFGCLAAEGELRDADCPEDEPTWLVPSNKGSAIRMSRDAFEALPVRSLTERATQR